METLTVQTLPIEIHVMKVGKRQMTKSIFKQIPLIKSHKFINSILGLKSNQYQVIGWVNYKPESSPGYFINTYDLLYNHLEYYNATGFLDYTDDKGYFTKKSYKEAFEKYFSHLKHTNKIELPVGVLQRGVYGTSAGLIKADINPFPLTSILMKCSQANSLYRGYVPNSYIDAFNFTQIYIAS